MKRTQSNSGVRVLPGVEVFVLPDERGSNQDLVDEVDKFWEDYGKLDKVLSRNYDCLSNKEIESVIGFLEKDLANGNTGKLSETEQEYKAHITGAVEDARAYLNNVSGQRRSSRLLKAAGYIIGAGLTGIISEGCGGPVDALPNVLAAEQVVSEEVETETAEEYKEPEKAAEAVTEEPAKPEYEKPKTGLEEAVKDEAATEVKPDVKEDAAEQEYKKPEDNAEAVKDETAAQPELTQETTPKQGEEKDIGEVEENPLKKQAEELEVKIKEAQKEYKSLAEQDSKIKSRLDKERRYYGNLINQNKSLESQLKIKKAMYDDAPENSPLKESLRTQYNELLEQGRSLPERLKEAEIKSNDTLKEYTEFHNKVVDAKDLLLALRKTYDEISANLKGESVDDEAEASDVKEKTPISPVEKTIDVYLEGNWGKDSNSGLVQASADGRIRAEVIHTKSKAETSDSSSESIDLGGGFTQTDYNNDGYEEDGSKTTLRVGFDISVGDYNKLMFDIIGSIFEKTTEEFDEQTTNVTDGSSTDLWINTRVDNDKVEEGFSYGLSLRYFMSIGGNADDFVDFGPLLKQTKSEIEETLTTDIDGTVDTLESGYRPDYASTGFTVGFHKFPLRGRANLIWNTGDDVSDYSGEDFEGNLYIFGELGTQSALGVDLSNRGGRTSGHVTWAQNFKNQLANIDQVARSLEENLNDEAMLGENPEIVENMRFMNALRLSDAWLIQLGGGEERGGYFEARVGQDIETKYNSQNLTWAVVTKQGKLDNMLGIMAYYSWKLKNDQLKTGVGINYTHKQNEDVGEHKQLGVGGVLKYDFN